MENPLRIAICEDVDADAALLRDCIDRSGIPAEWERFESGEALLRGFHAGQYDLVFMDIYMSGMRGVEAAEAIRGMDRHVVLAFTTTSPDHALESYRLGALKYLEKPVSPQGVRETLELVLMKQKARAKITLLIGGRQTGIPLDTILYFEQQNHVVEVHTTGGVLQTSQTVRMDGIEAALPSPPFVRSHHSFIVNLRYVQSVDSDFSDFIMSSGKRARIRRGCLKKMKEARESYLYALTREG